MADNQHHLVDEVSYFLREEIGFLYFYTSFYEEFFLTIQIVATSHHTNYLILCVYLVPSVDVQLLKC